MEQRGRTREQRRAAIRLRLGALLLVAVVAACSRGDATPRGTLVKVHESDFKLSTRTTRVPAGYVTFRIHNTGPSTHEFVVDRTAAAADALPLRANYMTVDEDSKELHSVGELGEIRLDTTRDLTLDLKPGHYVVYCNLEGHYRGGMYAAIEVTS